MKTIYTLLIITMSLCVSAQKMMSVKDQKKDLKQIKGLMEVHPDPYRHISEEEHNSLIDSIKNSIENELSVFEYYKKVAPILSILKDGHTGIYINNNDYEGHYKEYGICPLKVHLNNDQELFIIEYHGDNKEITVGAKITSINGRQVEDIVNELSSYLSYETPNFLMRRIEDAFHNYLVVLFGNFKSLDFGIFDTSDKTVTINNISYSDWKDIYDESEDKRISSLIKQHKPYEYSKVKNGVGMLKIHSFGIPDEQKFDFFVEKVFSSMAKDSIHSLIIDVRGNLGGFPKANAKLFHYITEKPFTTMVASKTKVSKRYQKYWNEKVRHINLRQARFRKTGYTIDIQSIMNQKPGTFVIEASSSNELPVEKKNEFTGDLYLLIDRESFSSASNFAATFRCYQMGLIIGEATGGTKVLHANNMIDMLKQSKMSVGMATAKIFAPCFADNPDENIEPDIQYKSTVQEKINGIDGLLYYTLRIIGKAQKLKAEEAKP